MAEEKQKEDPKADAGKKKKGLPPIVMIAVGAIAGGAGVVFAVPPKTIEVKQEVKPVEYVDVTNPDVIQHEFNPRTKAGKGVGRVALKFVYRVREDQEKEAYDRIVENWEQANSNVLLILKTRSYEELQTEAGVRTLEKDILDDLDRTLFPGDPKTKIARVTRVMWSKWLMQ
ncbi:MAG: flagellar basal body-associated FliL family protein [Planctomycetes bacterium]|nr:flagellar basal body-associated FliL family protein [Planctomycetota bacterium]